MDTGKQHGNYNIKGEMLLESQLLSMPGYLFVPAKYIPMRSANPSPHASRESWIVLGVPHILWLLDGNI